VPTASHIAPGVRVVGVEDGPAGRVVAGGLEDRRPAPFFDGLAYPRRARVA